MTGWLDREKGLAKMLLQAHVLTFVSVPTMGNNANGTRRMTGRRIPSPDIWKEPLVWSKTSFVEITSIRPPALPFHYIYRMPNPS
ncbi:hypothetical protein AVEN_222407-1 [Araneus ventricosus]|uniref:Uncharacterized protein n=1 Tax=Araneus ventricosus TaxID=182803 RepID=A0A4Y2MTU4_ARAVE|nr:hypothetical protein AVEN_222407-1 [Araneus ventricosus]